MQKVEIIVTVKTGERQKSFLMAGNRPNEKETDKFIRVGSPNEQILTSGQGLYVSRKLIAEVGKAEKKAKS